MYSKNQEPPPYGGYEAYPPPQTEGYAPAPYPPPAGGAYPPPGGAYPPPGGAYPPPGGAYPPPGGAYPPPGGAYPPPGDAYPPPGGAYPPQKGYAENETRVAIQGNDDNLIRRGNVGFSDPDVRRSFIRKVYLILCLQFAVTTGTILAMKFALRDQFEYDSGLRSKVFIATWVCFAVFLVTEIVLVCCDSVRRKHPLNIAVLGIFTLAMSGFVGCITLYYSVDAIVVAMGSTCIITIGLTLFACQTKIDFTGKGGYIFAAFLCFFCFGLFLMIFGTSRILQIVYGSIGVLIFSMFLVYDTQLLLGGRKYELTEEEYVFGALTIYIDVIQIFLMILSIFGNNN